MEGWLYTPATGIRQLPCVLPGLGNFYMVSLRWFRVHQRSSAEALQRIGAWPCRSPTLRGRSR